MLPAIPRPDQASDTETSNLSIIMSSRFILAAASLLLAASLHAGPADDLIKAGDVFDAKQQPNAALNCYLPAEKLEPKNVHLLVAMARQYRNLMPDAKSNDEKLRLGRIALDYSRRAAALGPDDAEAQLSPAITYGKLMPLEGKKEQTQSCPLIRASAERAIALDPTNDLAWHVLGRWHQVVADVGAVKRALGGLLFGKLPTSTHEEAVKCFDKAILLNPHRLRHYIELGRTYANMGKIADARCLIKKGLAMPDAEKDDPELKMKGRETLARLQ